MITLPTFVRLPSWWIEGRRLRELQWSGGQGANNVAALITLTVIAHHVDVSTGIARITYDALGNASSLSRTKISCGLRRLSDLGLVAPHVEGQSTYQLVRYDQTIGWAKFPAKPMYKGNTIPAFSDFKLRSRTELDAMKLFFLFVSRRDRKSNLAKISYEKIEEYAGIPRNNIKAGLSVLAVNSLVHIEHVSSISFEEGHHNAYRLVHVESRRHMGTLNSGGTDSLPVDPPF
jgi:hypothetical protein